MRLKERLRWFCDGSKRHLSLAFPSLYKLFYGLPELELESLVKDDSVLAPPILEDICLPPYYGPSDHDDLVPLMKIANSLQPRIVLELGTAYGNITTNICRQCPEAMVYTVNATAGQQTGSIVTYKLKDAEIGRVYRARGYGDRVIQILQNTLDLDLSEYMQAPVIDLAVIDACHDTEYVIHDFLKVLPFVRPQGVVMLHDTHPSMADHLLGSFMACMHLRRRGYDIRHIKGTWWAIWINESRNAGRLLLATQRGRV